MDGPFGLAGPSDGMVIRPEVVVLPAVRSTDYSGGVGDADEVERWLDDYAFDEEVAVDGLNRPIRYDSSTGTLLASTGIGKSAAASTVSALLASEALHLDDAHFVTVGIAGCRPESGTVGSVFVADAVVDWDLKYRIGETTVPLPWRTRDYVWALSEALTERAAGAAREATLSDSEAARELRQAYDDDRTPGVEIGTTVCGDEVWHGEACAATVADLCETYGLDGFATTEMEDAATATALERAGYLDRYVSVRAAANFDRQPPGRDPTEDLYQHANDLATENGFRAGKRVVDVLGGHT